jgi:hypothetical protein
MKKIYLIAFVLFAGLIFAGCKRNASQQGQPDATQKPRKSDKNVNQEPVENRPFVVLAPRADGKAIDLTIVEVKKAAADMEYEIEYSSGSLLQGAFGALSSLADLPIEKEILLGSCSTGGKCTYNKDVTGGNLTLRFGDPDYTLKTEWSYKEQALKEKVFTSRDGKFTLDVSKGKNTANFVLVHNAPGYPDTIDGKVIAGPYMVTPLDGITGTVTASIRLPLDAADGTLMAWDGKAWKAWTSKVTDKVVSGSGPMAEVFVIVAK